MKHQAVPVLALAFLAACGPNHPIQTPPATEPTKEKIRVIFDTDTNNELDDQHAMAYLLFNGPTFEVEGITVNTTSSGGHMDEQYAEAVRIAQLCELYGKLPILKGADGSFNEIAPTMDAGGYDGQEAVDFIVSQANRTDARPLTLIAVGKLTNVALALKKDPSLAGKMTVVWLGSNYPEPGEHNQNNDTVAMNYVLNTPVPFEMVTVRYGKESGTSAVTITKAEVDARMPGLGPHLATPITGRHGGEFSNFGDYSVSLFEHIDYHSDPPSRALFDLAAVAIVKDPTWARRVEIPCPIFMDGQWVERPDNPRNIVVWEYFDKAAILADFFATFQTYQPVDAKL